MVSQIEPTSALRTPVGIMLPTNPPTPAPPVLTASEVCLLLRIELDEGTDDSAALIKLQHYRNKGLLKGVQLGKKTRFKLTDILAFIDQQQEEVRR